LHHFDSLRLAISPRGLIKGDVVASLVRSCCHKSETITLGVVTDLLEVFRLGTAKAKENVAFRRYLSAHHYSDKPFQILATEVQQQVDCTACANCCRHSMVSVNKSEIENIASHIGATPEEVARLYTVPDPDAPALRILQNSGEGCVFLDGNLCMIYEARPKTCRDFPHVAVGTHSLGGRPSSLARWAALCPIIFNALESYKHLTGYHPRAVPDATSKPPV
jgi:Fe-S-cluster containining protein